MKTFIKLVIVLAIALASFSMPGSAKAGYIFRAKGPSADAYFSTIDGSGCVFTDIYVFASDNTNQSPPGRAGKSSSVNMFISQYDTCTDTQLFAADGFASLAPSEFQVNKKLTSASLRATVTMFDYVSGTPFDVFVDLDWTGNGPLSRQNGHSNYQSPGCSFKSRFNGTSRSAEVSGSVSDGTTNFTPEPFGGSIWSFKNSEMSIGCN